jgi:hypothetical protein
VLGVVGDFSVNDIKLREVGWDDITSNEGARAFQHQRLGGCGLQRVFALHGIYFSYS